jgi:hypothetical protein
VSAELAGKPVALKHAAVDGRLVVTFDSPLVIERGQSLRAVVTW